MDRDEALRLLRGGPEGIEEWNRRRKAGELIPDLSDADLIEACLNGADLTGADLTGADFFGADLGGAILIEARLTGADLQMANLGGAILIEARLTGADLTRADLRGVDLRGADLIEACLIWADLTRADLTRADLSKAGFASTSFSDVDLSVAKGLDSVEHYGSSPISTSTLILSRGKIPEAFLRGCGLPENWIEYLPSLIRGMEPIQFYSCFISYSSKDEDFARRLHADLQAGGVRCWFAPNDLKIGDRFRLRIDESIRLHDKLLLVLSEASVASQEVEAEVEAAMEREKSPNGGTVLFPVRLDDAAMKAPGWPALVRRTRHIGDFTRWKDHDAYQKGFARLLRDLKAVDAAVGESG